MAYLPKFLLSFLVLGLWIETLCHFHPLIHFVFSLLPYLGILGSLSLDQWEIRPQPSPSTSSRFYVLHNWESTYSQEENTAPLPTAKISDIMLKTMGILKVSLLYYTVFYSLAYIPMIDIGEQISANINCQLSTQPTF